MPLLGQPFSFPARWKVGEACAMFSTPAGSFFVFKVQTVRVFMDRHDGSIGAFSLDHVYFEQKGIETLDLKATWRDLTKLHVLATYTRFLWGKRELDPGRVFAPCVKVNHCFLAWSVDSTSPEISTVCTRLSYFTPKRTLGTRLPTIILIAMLS